MNDAWLSFRTGLTRALRHRRLLLILFATNLLSALVLMALPAASLIGPAYRPAIQDAADGVDAWMLIETLMGQITPRQTRMLGTSGDWGPVFGWLSLSAVLLPIAASLPRAFLIGGVLLTYIESPQPFRWRRFLWGSWRWFGAFLLLTLLQGIVLLVLVPLGLTALTVAVSTSVWLTWLTIPVLALFSLGWLAITELTRVAAVAMETRNVFKALAAAIRFVLKRPLPTLGFYALGLGLIGLIQGLFRGAILPFLPPERWLLFFLVQQIFVVAQLWASLARLAGGIALYQAELDSASSRWRMARAATLPEAEA